jgi:hypothetical protein
MKPSYQIIDVKDSRYYAKYRRGITGMAGSKGISKSSVNRQLIK